MRTLELYFNDLTPAAQEKYLKFQGVSDPSELNWEVNPITILDVENEPSKCPDCGSEMEVFPNGAATCICGHKEEPKEN